MWQIINIIICNMCNVLGLVRSDPAINQRCGSIKEIHTTSLNKTWWFWVVLHFTLMKLESSGCRDDSILI